MSVEFINPNWHVVIMHVPLGLLAIGVIIELLSLLWPGHGFRAAGRWMLLLGALTAIPTLTAGLYALRDTVLPGPTSPELPWHEVARRSQWSPEQWKFMTRHIWFNSFGVALFAVVAVIGLGALDRTRRGVYWPLLLLSLAGIGLLAAGAWHGGEAVYRMGTAVSITGQRAVAPAPGHGGEQPGHTHPEPQPPAPATAPPAAPQPASPDASTTSTLAPAAPSPSAAPAGDEHAGHDHGNANGNGNDSAAGHDHANGHGHAHPAPQAGGITYFVPPLQLHVLLAGFAVAFSLGALGLTLRRWRRPVDELNGYPRNYAPVTGSTGNVPGSPEYPAPTATSTMAAYEEPLLPSPRRFWLWAALVVLLTALAGAWSFMGSFAPEAWKSNWETIKQPAHARVLYHVIFGVTILLVTLILGIPPRLAWRHRTFSGILATLLLIAIVIQLWLGIAMLFDSHEGPLYRFTKPAATTVDKPNP